MAIINSEKYVSILGLADDVLMYSLNKSFDTYKLRDSNLKNYQVSPHEAENSTSCISTIVMGLESFAKRAEYIICGNDEHKEKFSKLFEYTVCKKCNSKSYTPLYKIISTIIISELKDKYDGIRINKKIINCILPELSKVRNNIAHNYLYEFTLYYDDDFELQDWNYTDISKNTLELKNDKTAFLNMNKIPNQISFIDILKAMIVFDTIIKLLELSVPGVDYRFAGYHKLGGNYVQDFYHIYCYYFLEMINLNRNVDLKEVNELIIKISKIINIKPDNSANDFQIELARSLKRSVLLRNTIINHVSYCGRCSTTSFILSDAGTNKCLNCEIKKLIAHRI